MVFFLDGTHIGVSQIFSHDQLRFEGKVFLMGLFGLGDDFLNTLLVVFPTILDDFDFLLSDGTVKVILFGEFLLFFHIGVLFHFNI
jgi:hypothetical protein